MSNHDFETELRAALHENGSTDVGRQQTSARVRSMVRQQGAAERIGFAAFLGTQVRFIGWKIWLVQALCLLAANVGLSNAFGMVYFTYPRLLVQCLCCLSVLVMLTALPVLYEAARCQMHEMEAATYFSSLRLLAAKLILVGAGDLAMLAALWCYTLWLTPLDARLLPLCLILPFLLAASGCLTLLGRLTPAHFCGGSVLWCVLLCCGFSFFSRQTLALSALVWPGIGLCVFLLGYCLLTLRRILRSDHFCELQLS